MSHTSNYIIKLNFIGFSENSLSKQVQEELDKRFAACRSEKVSVAVRVEHKEELGDLEKAWADSVQPRDIETSLEQMNKFEYFIMNQGDKDIPQACQATDEIADFCSDKQKFPIVIYKPRESTLDFEPNFESFSWLITSKNFIPNTSGLPNGLVKFIGDHYIMEKIGRIFTDGYMESKHIIMLPSPPKPVSDQEILLTKANIINLWEALDDWQQEFAHRAGVVDLADSENQKKWAQDNPNNEARCKELRSSAFDLAEGMVKAVLEPSQPDIARWQRSAHR